MLGRFSSGASRVLRRSSSVVSPTSSSPPPIFAVGAAASPHLKIQELQAEIAGLQAQIAQQPAVEAKPQLDVSLGVVRSNWTREEIAAIYRLPFTELLYRASTTHRMAFDPLEVQRCTLLSVKTGGCTEDCKYCAQSSRYTTSVKSTPLMPVMDVIEAAKRAKAAGSTRFCMGTAWRELGGKKAMFRRILQMVREVREMDMEVCCTLGMVSEEQAVQLKEAGLSAYNHNLDTCLLYTSPSPRDRG